MVLMFMLDHADAEGQFTEYPGWSRACVEYAAARGVHL